MLVLTLVTGLAAFAHAISIPRDLARTNINIPRGLADGVYSVSLDARGQEVHARLPQPFVPTPRSPSPLASRQRDVVRRDSQNGTTVVNVITACDCNAHFDLVNGTQAVADMERQLGNGTWFETEAIYANVKRAWASASSFRANVEILAGACGRDIVSAIKYSTFADGQYGVLSGFLTIGGAGPAPKLSKTSCPRSGTGH
ncbi:mitochondrial 54S ribosomal protein YmL39 [Purpureocillium lavendulum]|uniref:Mitochondrial 54S ribosomal protein YmL39 n=1 Tax=Purpureocillium lavendulum TaxID=1247861 RepID=A0AB34FRC5_9HYPO|nr:mitochondrial 54S ribosomal protein YmL39 [Purpureocillium lavendulum]